MYIPQQHPDVIVFLLCVLPIIQTYYYVFHVVATLPPSPDDDDDSNGIHVFYRRERVMADRGEPFTVINIVAPAEANELDTVNYNPLNGLTIGSEFQGLYQISTIMRGGVARAIYSDQMGVRFDTIGVLNTTVELFGKTLCVLYNPFGCSTQCSINMFTCTAVPPSLCICRLLHPDTIPYHTCTHCTHIECCQVSCHVIGL